MLFKNCLLVHKSTSLFQYLSDKLILNNFIGVVSCFALSLRMDVFIVYERKISCIFQKKA